MAIRYPNLSLFTYGIQVTTLNQSIDFASTSGQTAGTATLATLNLGFYTLSDLVTEIARALTAADPSHTYTVTVDRTVSGGTQNRVTIATTSSVLRFYFATGPRAASSASALMGFNASDYTGATSYSGSASAGLLFQPIFTPWNYLPPDLNHKIFGSSNVSALGVKEVVSFSVMKFWQAEYRFEPTTRAISTWVPFLDWAIQGRPLEHCPDVTDPATFYAGTLEKTPEDGQALAFTMQEMLPEFPGMHKTGLLTFRQAVPTSAFISG